LQSAFIMMHTAPGAKGWQSASLAQMGALGGLNHSMAGPQKHCVLILSTQKLKHGAWQKAGLLQSNGAHGLQAPPEAANAGVLMLVMIGADHATAAPAPIRLSIFRREIWPRASSGLSLSGMAASHLRNS
jgi:hypothetical protein